MLIACFSVMSKKPAAHSVSNAAWKVSPPILTTDSAHLLEAVSLLHVRAGAWRVLPAAGAAAASLRRWAGAVLLLLLPACTAAAAGHRSAFRASRICASGADAAASSTATSGGGQRAVHAEVRVLGLAVLVVVALHGVVRRIQAQLLAALVQLTHLQHPAKTRIAAGASN